MLKDYVTRFYAHVCSGNQPNWSLDWHAKVFSNVSSISRRYSYGKFENWDCQQLATGNKNTLSNIKIVDPY